MVHKTKEVNKNAKHFTLELLWVSRRLFLESNQIILNANVRISLLAPFPFAGQTLHIVSSHLERFRFLCDDSCKRKKWWKKTRQWQALTGKSATGKWTAAVSSLRKKGRKDTGGGGGGSKAKKKGKNALPDIERGKLENCCFKRLTRKPWRFLEIAVYCNCRP